MISGPPVTDAPSQPTQSFPGVFTVPPWADPALVTWMYQSMDAYVTRYMQAIDLDVLVPVHLGLGLPLMSGAPLIPSLHTEQTLALPPLLRLL